MEKQPNESIRLQHKKRLRINPGRSKHGCLTCRTKRVKCDETLPICRRCLRLGLDCQQPSQKCEPSEPKKTGYRPLKPREKSPALSNISLQSDPMDSPGNLLNLNYSGQMEEDFSRITPDGWDRRLWQAEFPSFDDDDALLSTSDHNLSSFGFLRDASLDLLSTTSPPYNLSTYHITLPNSLQLEDREHSALKHYHTSFAREQTSRHPQWSFPNLLLRCTSHSAMTMHFILAVSFHDMDLRSEEVADMRQAAHAHFERGSQLLRDILTTRNYPDEISLMASFYFVYLYMSMQRKLDPEKIDRLSRTILDHIRGFALDRFSIATTSNPLIERNQGRRQAVTPSAKQSLLARLLFWLYKEDVYCSLYGCGGTIAEYLQHESRQISEIWEASKSILQLNWGPEYPANESLRDVWSSQTVDMMVDLLHLRFEITGKNPLRQHDHESKHDEINRHLEALETKYAAIFHIASSQTLPSSELVVLAASNVASFHALRIFHLRNSKIATIEYPEIQISLKALLQAAHRVASSDHQKHFDGFQWALFIAGIETDDLLHRDWILSKISIPRFKTALDAIIAARQICGDVGINTIKDVFCGTLDITVLSTACR